MKLSESGSIKIDGYNCIFTNEGQWAISKHGTPLGYVDTIAEVQPFIASNLERTLECLRLANEEAAARLAEKS